MDDGGFVRGQLLWKRKKRKKFVELCKSISEIKEMVWCSIISLALLIIFGLL